jgi:predicted phage tail protein
MRKVILHGHLRKKFGAEFSFDVQTAGEAIRALYANFGTEFLKALEIGSYQIVRGKRKTGMHIDLEIVNTFNVGNADLHLVPVAEGSAQGGGKGGGGALKAVLGVALIGVAVFMSAGAAGGLVAGLGQTAFSIGPMSITWGNIAMFGMAMTLAGVSQMLAPKEEPKDESKDESFAFSGPVNMNEQGSAVPLVYGEVITGSIPASAGIDIEDIGSYKVAA